jgi:hypothetical protein
VTVSSLKSPSRKSAAFYLTLVLAGAVVSPDTAVGQTSDEGGIQLSFGLSLRLEAQDNRALNAQSAGSSFESRANLSFGLLTETRLERLAFSANGALRTLDTPTNDAVNGFIEPALSLSYGRTGANATLSFEASLREKDLSDNALFIDDTGAPVVISGTATQRNTQLEGGIDWGTSAPFGYGVFARLEDTTYRGGTALGLDGAQLNDSRRMTLGVTTRMNLGRTTGLNTHLIFSTFEQDGTPDSRETVSLRNLLTLERPLGAVTLALNLVDTEDGTRAETSIGRSLEMPLGVLSGAIGATRATTGNVLMTGELDYQHILKSGRLNFGLVRDVSSSDGQDTEQLNTRLRFGYFQELTALSTLRFDTDLAETKQTGTDLTSATASVGATYSHALTRDWNLDLGYRHRYRDSDVTMDDARSNTVFMDLRRVFTGRF